MSSAFALRSITRCIVRTLRRRWKPCWNDNEADRMYYTIRHLTRFRYSQPITESMMEVRMQPRRTAAQHCLSFELTTDPRAYVIVSQDYLGNLVHHFDLPHRHTQLTITAQALVSVTTPPPLPDALPPHAWDELDAMVKNG